MPEAIDLNRRSVARLSRPHDHSWQLRVDEDRLITKNIINISPMGMSFKAPGSMPLKPGETVRLSISLSSQETFECEGRILWSRPATEKAGSMQLVGVQFFSIPARYDALIMKHLHDIQLRDRRDDLKQAKFVSPRQRTKAEMTVRSMAAMIISAVIIAAFTVALLTAAWLHSQNHPEQDIARKFNDAMARKLSAIPPGEEH
jgi:hypothetical protein